MSAGSGIVADDACLPIFNLVKTKKKDFALFEFNSSRTSVVPVAAGGIFPDEKDEAEVKAFDADEKEKKREANFKTRVMPKFKAALVGRGKVPTYAVLDFRFFQEGDRPTDKLLFFFWCPDTVGVRDKMVGASTYTSFSAKLGVAAKIQLQEAADLDFDAIVAKAK